MAQVSGPGRLSAPTCSEPMATTWLTTAVPSRARRALARQPAATRAAVSRADARLQDVAGVVEAVFLHPGQVGVTRAGFGQDLGRRRPGSGDISCSHFGHSVLPISMATGDPRVRPWRMPASRITSSASNRIRGPRPNPSRRRASSPPISSR